MFSVAKPITCPYFLTGAPRGISAEAAVRGKHAMARDQNWNRIRAACLAHRADGFQSIDSFGDFAVAHRFAGWNRGKNLPDTLLKIRSSGEVQRRKLCGRFSV